MADWQRIEAGWYGNERLRVGITCEYVTPCGLQHGAGWHIWPWSGGRHGPYPTLKAAKAAAEQLGATDGT